MRLQAAFIVIMTSESGRINTAFRSLSLREPASQILEPYRAMLVGTRYLLTGTLTVLHTSSVVAQKWTVQRLGNGTSTHHQQRSAWGKRPGGEATGSEWQGVEDDGQGFNASWATRPTSLQIRFDFWQNPSNSIPNPIEISPASLSSPPTFAAPQRTGSDSRSSQGSVLPTYRRTPAEPLFLVSLATREQVSTPTKVAEAFPSPALHPWIFSASGLTLCLRTAHCSRLRPRGTTFSVVADCCPGALRHSTLFSPHAASCAHLPLFLSLTACIAALPHVILSQAKPQPGTEQSF